MHEFAFVFAGFAVGLIVGLTGVGGGSLMTPVLIFFFGVKPHLAIGTDLLFAAFTKMGGTVSLARQRMVPWRVVGLLCAGSIPAALLALWVLQRLGPDSAQVQHLMTSTLGFALLLVAAGAGHLSADPEPSVGRGRGRFGPRCRSRRSPATTAGGSGNRSVDRRLHPDEGVGPS